MEEYTEIKGIFKDHKTKQEVVNKALETAGHALGVAFITCGLETHITGDFVIGEEKFTILFKKNEQG